MNLGKYSIKDHTLSIQKDIRLLVPDHRSRVL